MARGAIKAASIKFAVSDDTVSRIWKLREKINLEDPSSIRRVLGNKKKGRVGTKRGQIDQAKVQSIPYEQRETIRSLADAMGMPKSTIFDHVKAGNFRWAPSIVKPVLTDYHRLARMQYCLSNLIPKPEVNLAVFKEVFNTIHVDEKWFYLRRARRGAYLGIEEPTPQRHAPSKRFIPKVMFLSAICRPHRNKETGVVEFDGKLGIFPFIQREPAKRASRNRPRGTLVVKNVTVDAQAYLDMLCDEVLPAIHQKFPNLDVQIKIQQDNAGPHVDPLDATWREAVESTGVDIELYNQPANSPDLNINDLGFFRAIEALQQKKRSRTFEELIGNVNKAFEAYSADDINKIWVTHQSCMVEILKALGGNQYKIPHMNKNKLLKEGNLPTSLSVPLQLYEDCKRHVETIQGDHR